MKNVIVKRRGIGLGAGETVEILPKEKIVEIIENLDPMEIIKIAYDGYIRSTKSGYAELELETGKLTGSSLGAGDSNQAIDNTVITLYEINQLEEFCECDILTEDEIEEEKELTTEDILDYLEYNFNQHEFWKKIDEQLEDWYGNSIEKKMTLTEAVEKAIWSAKHNLHSVNNDGVQFDIVNTETGETLLGYNSTQVEQWDYAEEEWEEIDFHLLAEEVLENLGIEYDEKEIYEVVAGQ